MNKGWMFPAVSSTSKGGGDGGKYTLGLDAKVKEHVGVRGLHCVPPVGDRIFWAMLFFSLRHLSSFIHWPERVCQMSVCTSLSLNFEENVVHLNWIRCQKSSGLCELAYAYWLRHSWAPRLESQVSLHFNPIPGFPHDIHHPPLHAKRLLTGKRCLWKGFCHQPVIFFHLSLFALKPLCKPNPLRWGWSLFFTTAYLFYIGLFVWSYMSKEVLIAHQFYV